MKYIRTKDGKIYELQETKSGEKYLVRTNELIPLWNTKEYEIVKEADTIEELCDKFIGVEENGTPHIFAYECDLLDLIHNTERRLGTKVTGYGAIWAKKGLIYVAKMNEKGELELL